MMRRNGNALRFLDSFLVRRFGAILDYIAVHSPLGARRVQARIRPSPTFCYSILTSDAARAIRRFAG
jgi:hypothetical protein